MSNELIIFEEIIKSLKYVYYNYINRNHLYHCMQTFLFTYFLTLIHVCLRKKRE